MRNIIITCVSIVLAITTIFVISEIVRRKNEEVVLRVALFPRSLLNYSIYHEIRYNVATGRASMESFEGVRAPDENIEERNAFFMKIQRIRRTRLDEQDYLHLMSLAHVLELSDYIFEESNALGISEWRFIVMYNDMIYKMDRWAEDAEEMEDIIAKIIQLSPIEMHERFSLIPFP